jgi:hypothetical protein
MWMEEWSWGERRPLVSAGRCGLRSPFVARWLSLVCRLSCLFVTSRPQIDVYFDRLSLSLIQSTAPHSVVHELHCRVCS